MNVCTKVHNNPSNRSRDISLKTTDVNLVVALNLQNVVPIYLVIVEVFHRISENSDWLVALEERIHRIVNMNVCTSLQIDTTIPKG